MQHDDSELLDYAQLVDNAMRSVVQQALHITQLEGLEEDHHFYITFRTDYPGVELSPQLRSQHQNEMTIVLQHQFWDLQVDATAFSIMLSFNHIPEKLVIPFDALTAFADPSVNFGLQFRAKPGAEELVQRLLSDESAVASFEEEAQKDANIDTDNGNEKSEPAPQESGGRVISIDAFRKGS